ncbi:hypothetical protein [Ferrimonas lipolytica]|uniref:Uncharacterized protein n=1 Tax=Ferrimonas lipolytica TaxID=2724191 RepID=A0A6H1UER6_9GAMM|nr:hypothetical protein [Ferrimonas lipolytica]QIZ77597.1 hypothetical protein HER31_12250 [Ferrimonas lipolytica]
MINSVSSSTYSQMQPTRQTETPMSDEQKQLVTDTLSNYDSDNLSSSDAIAITEAFAEAGINPSQELATMMTDTGFDAASIGDQAKAGNPPPPPPSSSETVASLDISDEMATELSSLLDSYASGTLSDEAKAETLTSIQAIFAQTAPENGLVDVTA